MDREIDRLTGNGTVSQEVYRILRDAIRRTGEQAGQLFDAGHEAHYQALAVVMALKASGYAIERTRADG